MTENDKFGYIPVYNYIIKIKILDDILLNKNEISKNNPEFCRYVTSNFCVIEIINYLTDTIIDEIEYIIDELAYNFYGQYSDKSLNMTFTKYYKHNNIHSDKRYYYKTFERALSETFIRYKLYTKYPNGYTGEYISYHYNGDIREKYYHNNGIKEGKYIKYYFNNFIEEETDYVNGMKHGCSKGYNGELNVIENYVMDKLDGLCIYNNFGRLSKEYRVEISYKNGIIDGIYKKYYKYKEGGGLHIECNFRDGKYFGIYKEYDRIGNLLIECDYKTYNKEIDVDQIM